jgi:hypothetical protein
MSERLSAPERALLWPARRAEPSPIPTQVISNGEFLPAPQGELQKKFDSKSAPTFWRKSTDCRAAPFCGQPREWRRLFWR